MIHFVCFASEGPPYDEGFAIANVVFPRLEKLKKELNFCDVMHLHTPRTIRELPGGAYSVQDNGIEEGIIYNFGYSRVGSGAWRAFLLKYIMENHMNDGDIFFLHDCNFIKYPAIIDVVIPKMREYVNAVMKVAPKGLFAPMHLFMHGSTSKNVFEVCFDNNMQEASKFYHAPVGRARTIVCQKNDRVVEFADLFEKTCREKNEILSHFPHAGVEASPGTFSHNCYEQGVFNCLAYKTGMFDLNDIFIAEHKNNWNYGADFDSGAAFIIDLAKKMH